MSKVRKSLISFVVFFSVLLAIVIHLIDKSTMLNKYQSVNSMSYFSLYLYSAASDFTRNDSTINRQNMQQYSDEILENLERAKVALISARPLYRYYGITTEGEVESGLEWLISSNHFASNTSQGEYLRRITPLIARFHNLQHVSVSDVNSLLQQLTDNLPTFYNK